MGKTKITIVGLGPGALGLLTVETLDRLENAGTLLLRTAKHPTVTALSARGIKFESYDDVYEEKTTFEAVYQTIAQDCVMRAEQGDSVVFAVPGSPMVAEKTVPLIRALAKKSGIAVEILPGVSFLETMYTSLSIDPVDGITIIDAADIVHLPPDLDTALVITQVYNKQVASDAKLVLMERFKDDYPIIVVRNLSLDTQEIHELSLFELDRLPVIDHLTSVYVPPRQKRSIPFSLDPVVDVMARLRSPGGCVWDIEQTHDSLRRYMVEEVYETLEAIDLADGDQLCEELGDLLLQIVFHARVAEECGTFTVQDVINTVTEKLVRRHPHVFGDITVRNAAEVVVNWEQIKKGEKPGQRLSVLDGIPHGLPSLMRAYKLQLKAAKVGFDWDNIAPVWEKIKEELAELQESVTAGTKKEQEQELGDVLFAVVNLGRFLGLESEIALNMTNNKFIKRFTYIEDHVKAQGLLWEKLTLPELDLLWEQAKKP